MNTEKAKLNDAKTIAELHKKEIALGFISSLNIKVIEKLYQTIIKEELVFVLKDEGIIIGFVSCAINTGKLYKKFILSNLFQLIPLFIGKIFSISFIKKIIETLKAPSKSKQSESEEELPELLSIVVDTEKQARGAGKLLLDELEKELYCKQIKKYKVVAGDNLISANKFYLKNDFVLNKKTEIHKGAVSNIYVKNLIIKEIL